MKRVMRTLLILLILCSIAATAIAITDRQQLATCLNTCSSIDSIPPISNSTPSPKLANDAGIEISGLIIDETRSKAGRDFYDLFYRQWIPPADQFAYTIIVKELPARGRVSRVSVHLNDELLTQRVLQPRNDIIEAQVNYTIRILNAHIRKGNALQQQLENEDTQGSGIF